MTPQEFKAWFDGFTEGLQGLPNEDQWARIKARVAQIDNTPLTKTVFIDSYWPRRRYWSSDEPYWTTFCSSAGASGSLLSTAGGTDGFDSMKAMYSLGASEASEFSVT